MYTPPELLCGLPAADPCCYRRIVFITKMDGRRASNTRGSDTGCYTGIRVLSVTDACFARGAIDCVFAPVFRPSPLRRGFHVASRPGLGLARTRSGHELDEHE